MDRRGRFEAEVLAHLDAAFRYARWLAPAAGEADDIVQEAILKAFRAFDGLRVGDPRAWLFAIVRNCHLTALRQQQRRGFVPLPDEDGAGDGQALVAATPDPESASIRRDERRTLARLMADLPDEQREVLVLREIEDMDYRAIADITQVPIGTVMSRLARARAALRARWLRDAAGETHDVR